MSKNVYVMKIDRTVIAEAVLADTFFNRLIGLLPVKALDENKGIILKPCRQIHTFHMKYEIDAVFLSPRNEIIHIVKNIKPNKVTDYIRNAKSVVELYAGTAEKHGLAVGDTLRLEECVEISCW